LKNDGVPGAKPAVAEPVIRIVGAIESDEGIKGDFLDVFFPIGFVAVLDLFRGWLS
jgi:hypothetical protein